MSKQLDLFGDYLVEDMYDELLEDVATEDLLDNLPSNSITWFANLGEEIVGFSSDEMYSPQQYMFELIKLMHFNKDMKIYEALDAMRATTYFITTEEELINVN